MTAFSDAYHHLNPAQRLAVDTIDGPLMVIAGPGTGKTQLLSARVANILQQTDTPAQNILCLTFTDSGAANMRDRLSRFIGQAAYDVTISTYHTFGSNLITRYPEYFGDDNLLKPIDELARRQLLVDIVDALDYTSPLKQTRHHIGDLISTISEIKRAMLDSTALRTIVASNLQFIIDASNGISLIFAGVAKMPGTLSKSRPYFEQTLDLISALQPGSTTEAVSQTVPSLSVTCADELQIALDASDAANKSTPLTKWKNKWLAKNADNNFILAGQLENNRLYALADVLDAYQTLLEERQAFDFDDMILRSIKALETHLDMRYTLQEKYLYIMLDEFQDTNAAQLRLVQLLTDSPINEGRPNILAVGDDDQAIYAFQGAQYSNMMVFYTMFRDTLVINLTENYRSHADILLTARNIADQIESRLDTALAGGSTATTKILTASNHTIGTADVERREFQTDIAERAWIAGRIKTLINDGVPAREIAVLTPKHKQLEQLVPYLNALDIPVRYEKRENILEAPVVHQILTMCRLIVALSDNNQVSAGSLWPEVLSYEFWEIPTAVIWELSWQVSDDRSTDTPLTWSKAVMASENNNCQTAATVLLAAALSVTHESCETVIDYLVGSQSIRSSSLTHANGTSSLTDLRSNNVLYSPLRQYYTSPAMQQSQPELFYQTLSHLKILRSKILSLQESETETITVNDLLRFVAMYQTAKQPMTNTSPYSQQADAVQLSTVFKAKGLEYQHVFVPHCLDDVWGSSAKGNTNKLTIPANVAHIRHAGATDDERLRILFVAVTRAKTGLYLTSASSSYNGKATKRLKYFDEREQVDGSYVAMILPGNARHIVSEDDVAPLPKLLELDWQTRHTSGYKDATLAGLLAGRTDDLRLSPTHLIKFLDLEYAGPQQFFFDVVLRFPNAPSDDSRYGTSIHETLEWYQHQVSEHGYAPTIDATIERFVSRISASRLSQQRIAIESARGTAALTSYLRHRGQIFGVDDVAEKNFRSDNVQYTGIALTGKIDRLEIDTTNKTITIVDYKTGTSYSTWKKDLKMHKYRIQLYAYKILVENSRTFRDYTVTTGRLEFVEPDNTGQIHSLSITYENTETERVGKLLSALWAHTKSLSFPITDLYQPTLAGVMQFEQDLIEGKI